jgi:hypothetical protein
MASLTPKRTRPWEAGAWRMGLASLCFNGYNEAMAKDPAPSTPFRIDAEELSWVEITDNGRRLCLRLRDRVGHPASVSIPVDSVNAILTAVPRSADELLQGGATEIYKLDGWSLGWNAAGLVLTLQLPDGAKIAFAVKPWQIAAIASLAGQPPARRGSRLH